MVQMRKDFDLEYDLVHAISKRKDQALIDYKDALKKLIGMLKYPRLIHLLDK